MLTGWFKLNSHDASARQLLYTQILKHYTWKANKKFEPRLRGHDKVIARLFTASPKNSELWHLRLLLLHRRGCMSFEDLYTVEGTRHGAFKEAAHVLGLLADYAEWERALTEMSSYSMPRLLRSMFAYICAFEHTSNAGELRLKFRDCFSKDYARDSSCDHFAAALADIQVILQSHNQTMEEVGLPSVSARSVSPAPSSREKALVTSMAMKALANPAQIAIINEVLEPIDKQSTNRPNAYFVDGPGGSGKTFVYQCLIHLLKGSGKLCIPVAWTGIAAMLLPRGRTVHNRFRFPLNMTEETVSGITYQSPDGEMFRACSLIIWDDAPMASGPALQAVDRFLRDITGNNDMPFGGKVLLLGDFCQVLPVVPRGGRALSVMNSN